MAADLPDELIHKILEIGIQNSNPNSNSRLSYKDLCCLSISSRRLRHVANDLSLWSSLLSLDFPSRLTESTNRNDALVSPKLLYRSWFEKEKAKRIAAEKRAVMRVESRIAEHMRRVEDILRRRGAEEEKIKCVADEINNLRRVRQASVALNVWQPEIILGRQKQIVEQCAVPVDSRINALEMELRLCKQQLMDFGKSYRAEKRRLEEERERLTSMKYHPLYDHSVIPSTVDGHKTQSTAVDHNTKRKKFKRFSDDFTS